MNDENLKPNSERTPKERSDLARKAGQASGAARRERKTLRERLLLLAEQTITNKKGEQLEREEVIALQVMNKAVSGDLKATKLYAELTGQIAQKVEINNAPPITILPHEKR